MVEFISLLIKLLLTVSISNTIIVVLIVSLMIIIIVIVIIIAIIIVIIIVITTSSHLSGRLPFGCHLSAYLARLSQPCTAHFPGNCIIIIIIILCTPIINLVIMIKNIFVNIINFNQDISLCY